MKNCNSLLQKLVFLSFSALFYVRKTVEESGSRSVLIDNIKAHLYQSSGNTMTNFAEKLPIIQGKPERLICFFII